MHMREDKHICNFDMKISCEDKTLFTQEKSLTSKDFTSQDELS